MRPVSNLERLPVSHSANRPVSHLATQPSGQSAILPAGQSASWPVSQPARHLVAHGQYQLADRSLLVAVETVLWAGSRVGTYNDVGCLGRGRIKPLRRTSSLH